MSYKIIQTHPTFEIDDSLPIDKCIRHIETKQYLKITNNKTKYVVYLPPKLGGDGKIHLLHRLIAESYYYFKKNYAIRFKDKNPLNYKLDNLIIGYENFRMYSKNVKKIQPDGTIIYYQSVKDCAKLNFCKVHNIYDSIRFKRPYDDDYYEYV